VGNNPYALFQPFISNYSVMVGPQYFVRQRRNYAVSGQVLAGFTYNLFYADSVGHPGSLVGLYPNETRFTAAAAVPVDINLGPGLAFRIAPTYDLTTWGGDIQHNLGFTLALNYRFGRQ
jgi:lipopolysaccharide assembly outer membrane protein LptD (OstA)